MNNLTDGQEIIYGCMGLGGSWSSAPITAEDAAVAERAIEAALDAGMRTFDHADIYRAGKAEEVFGEILRANPSLRASIRIQTKCSIRLGEHGLRTHYNLTSTSIVERVSQSLERLATDHIDTLLLHRIDPLTPPQEIAGALNSLYEQGLVRSFGASNMSAAQLDLLQSYMQQPLRANQLELSLRKRDWLEVSMLHNQPQGTTYNFPEGTLEYCMKQGVRLQAWGPLAQGVYSGAAADDASDADRATADVVSRIANENHTTAEAVVLGWLMKHPAGISPVIGTTNPRRIGACRDAHAMSAALSRVEWYELLTTARGATLP